MTQQRQASVIRPTDEEARQMARVLIRAARFGAIAVLEPETGHPFSSRILLGTDIDGVLVMLVSALSVHTRAILNDPRCGILVGEPGKGDPLAWPRLSVLAEAERVGTEAESHSHLRERFLRRHPKARLYIDFPDFSFFRLVPKSANLNGGFGKAYNISRDDLIIRSPVIFDIKNQELQLIAELNARPEGIATLLAKHFFNEKTDNWIVVGLDAAGLDVARKEQVLRFELADPMLTMNGLIAKYSNIGKYVNQN